MGTRQRRWHSRHPPGSAALPLDVRASMQSTLGTWVRRAWPCGVRSDCTGTLTAAAEGAVDGGAALPLPVPAVPTTVPEVHSPLPGSHEQSANTAGQQRQFVNSTGGRRRQPQGLTAGALVTGRCQCTLAPSAKRHSAQPPAASRHGGCTRDNATSKPLELIITGSRVHHRQA